MEQLPLGAGRWFLALKGVKLITDNRMAQPVQVGPQLVSAPRLRLQAEQGIGLVVGALHLPLSYSLFRSFNGLPSRALAKDGSTHWVTFAPSQWLVNPASPLNWYTKDERDIFLLHPPALELLLEVNQGLIIFGCHQNARGVFIKAMGPAGDILCINADWLSNHNHPLVFVENR